MNKKNKYDKGLILSWTIITILVILLIFTNNKYVEDKQASNNKIYVGYGKGVSDNAYEDLLANVIEIQKNTKDNKTKEELGELIKSQEGNQVNIENFNRNSAVNSLRELLIDVGTDPSDTEKLPADSIKDRLTMLDDEKTDMEDVLTKKTIDKLYMSEEFQKDKFNRQFASSTLIVYYDVIIGNGNTKIEPVLGSYDDLIYLDTRFMTAHIPLDLFTGGNTGISFEMQYVDGEWKLNPYTAMQSLNLMTILNAE